MVKNSGGMKNKIVLVTGGAGFIGSHMCEKLLSLGARTICFDDLSTGRKENISESLKDRQFVFAKGDANRRENFEKIFRKFRPDYAIHYAATVGVKRTLKNPLAVLRDIEGIKNILECARKYKVKKAVFASSSEVYGEPQELPVIEENTPLNAKLPYAAVKVIGENYFRSYHRTYGLPTVSLRFFNVYGPKQDSSGYGFVTAIFMKQALAGKPPTVFGNGRQTRDFMFIEDNINATIAAILNRKATGETINIGTGRETTILELANKIIKISGKKLKPVFLSQRKEGEIARRCPHIAKMKRLLGYRPQFNIDKGLKKTYEWYSEQSANIR